MTDNAYTFDDMSIVHHIRDGVYFLVIGGDTFLISEDAADRLISAGITVSEGS